MQDKTEIHKFLPTGVKILVVDIETSPNLAYVWGAWKQNVALKQMVSTGKMLSWAAKWVGIENMMYDYNLNHGEDPLDDRGTVLSLHRLLDNADIIVTYNGKNFDIPYFQARCIEMGLEPPSPYKHVDLFQVVKQNFRMPHRSLDAVAKHLGLEGKKSHSGFELWVSCIAGDMKAWEEMIEYNIQDISVTENVYRALRPWIKNHPNMGVFMPEEDEPVCPKCGGKHIHFRGYATTSVSRFRRFQCLNCGGWGRVRLSEKGSKKPQTVNEI